jgi:amidohydrolase
MSRADPLGALRRRLDLELPEAVELRHELHRQPELSGQEAGTRDRVLAALPGGASARSVAKTGAVLRIGGTGPAVAVRAELDALAVPEASGTSSWASQHPGVMHACGHDVHLAALVALCRAVAAVGGPAPLLAVLQPREETYPSGARDICGSGVLRAEQAQITVGAHVQPLLPVGTVACTPGTVNASSDEFTIVVRGMGGHAAYPHLTHDPVLALAQVVVALQSLVSRRADPMRPVVISVTTLRAGAAANVVPDTATARGTVRAVDPDTRRGVLAQLPELVGLVARAHGCDATIEIADGEPALVNDSAIAAATAKVLANLGARVDDTLHSMGSDDFAHYSTIMPVLMMFVGVGAGVGDRNERLHSATFVPADERVGEVARALLAGYAAAASMLPAPPSAPVDAARQ